MAHTDDNQIHRPAQIKLFNSPVRIEIYDALEACTAPISVAELGAQLGRAADGLYYHLRVLVAAGLVVEEGSGSMLRYRTPARAGRALRMRYSPGKTANAAAVARAVGSLLRVGERDFKRALANPHTVVEGPRRELWAGRAAGWVTTTELEEINRLLAHLTGLLHNSQGKRGGRRMSLAWVLGPLDVKPPRRASKARTKPRAGSSTRSSK
ncbi:winged helix-turn-helix domain-containing protein [Dokdonella sp.]|uniref:winged helix-turn-helix domain-containing protein n=1 Tax=Dokdonella sp. TaxID=2291710 RepID=UPI0025BE1C33|nr:winged helix-turn-helix domain-containing protein [Dokdonella sp.]MBX3690165.1 helix-turn-helix transcriptional regulator [Dokdonella sp.]